MNMSAPSEKDGAAVFSSLLSHRLWEEVMRLKKLFWLLLGVLSAALLRRCFPSLRSLGSAERELLRSVGSFIARQEAVFVR